MSVMELMTKLQSIGAQASLSGLQGEPRRTAEAAVSI